MPDPRGRVRDDAERFRCATDSGAAHRYRRLRPVLIRSASGSTRRGYGFDERKCRERLAGDERQAVCVFRNGREGTRAIPSNGQGRDRVRCLIHDRHGGPIDVRCRYNCRAEAANRSADASIGTNGTASYLLNGSESTAPKTRRRLHVDRNARRADRRSALQAALALIRLERRWLARGGNSRSLPDSPEIVARNVAG